MTILCAHKGINGISREDDFTLPTPPVRQGHAGLVNRLGPDCFKTVFAFLSLSEQCHLSVTHNDNTAWRQGIIHLDFSQKSINRVVVENLLATLPNLKSLRLDISNPDFLPLHFVPTKHPSLQSLAFKVQSLGTSSLAGFNDAVLTHLNFSACSVDLILDPIEFTRFTRLEQLIFDNTGVRTSHKNLPAQIQQLTSLRYLRLDSGDKLEYYRDEDFASLSSLTRLETLVLSDCNIGEKGFEALANLPTLRVLDFIKCPLITATAIRSLANNSTLEVLKIQGSRVTDTGIEELMRHHHLKELWIAGSLITDKALEILSQIPTLELLTLFGCPQITNRGLAFFATSLHLRKLDLFFCSRITNNIIAVIAEFRQAHGLPPIKMLPGY